MILSFEPTNKLNMMTAIGDDTVRLDIRIMDKTS